MLLRKRGLLGAALLAMVAIVGVACSADATPAPAPRAPAATSTPLPPVATSTPIPTATPRGPAGISAVATATATATATSTPLPTATSTTSPTRGGTLRYAFPYGQDPTQWDLLQSSGAIDHGLLVHVYGQLLRPTTFGTLRPLMADEWTLSGDGKTWTIKIKEGIKFHSGETLTSEDVAFTINRAANPPEGITSRRAGLGLVESAKVAGPLTVSVKMSGANPDLIMDLAAPLMVIYRKAEVEPMDKALTRFMTAADGNGPFKLKESVRGQYYEAEAFDGYHEAGLPYLDSIKMYIVSDLNAMEAALRSNRLDLIHQLAQPDLLAGLESDFAGKITVEAVPWQSNAMCSPNQAKQFKNLDIRRAVNLAMDRDKALNVLGPSGIITYLGGIMPPAHPMALPEAELRKLEGYAVGDAKVQEVELAKKLIKDGGYEGMEFKILTRHGSLFAEAAAFMQDQLKVVGLKPSLEPVEPAIFYPRANAGDHDFACNLSLAFGVSTNAILEEFTMEGGSRWYGQWSDPEMKKRLYELETEVDAAKRKTLIYDYQRDFIERGYNVVMGFRLVDMEYWSYVKGLNMYSVPIAEQWYAEAWFAPR